MDNNYKDILKIGQIYAKDMQEVFRRLKIQDNYLKQLLSCQRYNIEEFVRDMPKICQRYTKDISKISYRYAKDMDTYAKYMLKIYQIYAKDMPKIS